MLWKELDMGHLVYGNLTEPIEIPDRILAHLRVVATTKLRRGECFTMSWHHPDGHPGGLSTIWMQPAIPLRFVFDAEPDAIDGQILQSLASAASSSKGLLLDLDMFGELARPALAVQAA